MCLPNTHSCSRPLYSLCRCFSLRMKLMNTYSSLSFIEPAFFSTSLKSSWGLLIKHTVAGIDYQHFILVFVNCLLFLFVKGVLAIDCAISLFSQIISYKAIMALLVSSTLILSISAANTRWPVLVDCVEIVGLQLAGCRLLALKESVV